MQRPRPHDTPAGPNPNVRDLTVEVLADHWYVLRRATFDYRRPDGTWRTEHREAYDRGNGVCALLHDPVRDTVLLVRQYRVPAHLNGHRDGMLLEVPAGLVDPAADTTGTIDEDATEAIRRELAEEVGHSVHDLRQLWTLYMSPGSVTEHVTFFAGRYDESTRTGPGGGEDAGEQIDVVELTVDDALAMIADGRIVDGKTVLLLTHLTASRAG